MLDLLCKNLWLKMAIPLRQFIFGVRVFFKYPSLRNCAKITKFLFKRYLLRKPVPFSVVFSVTYKCQCNCIHCSINDYKNEDDELSIDEIKRAIDFIDNWGPVKIIFFGGEPLLRRDIIQLVDYVAKKGIRVSIDTNCLLLDEDMIAQLKNARISNINISIDSCRGDIHDVLRQKKGSFRSAINGLNLCVQYKIPCLISTYASKRAIVEGDLEGIIKLAKVIGVSGVKILFPILSGKWRTSEQQKLSTEEESHVRSLLNPSFVYIEDALAMVGNNGKGCSAMERNLIYISPYGDVQPCPAIPITFGNIRKESLEKIIKTMEGSAFFNKYGSCETCLMNESIFRESYFSSKSAQKLPINVKEFNL